MDELAAVEAKIVVTEEKLAKAEIAGNIALTVASSYGRKRIFCRPEQAILYVRGHVWVILRFPSIQFFFILLFFF
jgi:hypothetical protein